MSANSDTPYPDSDPHDPVDEPSGPPYRAIAMVLLTAVVIAVAIGLVQLFSGQSEEQPTASTEQSQPSQTAAVAPAPAPGESATAPNRPAPGQDPLVEGQPPTPVDGAPADGQPSPAPDAQGAPPAVGAPAVPVSIYNNSNISGLAGRTGDQLRGAGYDVRDVSNYPSSQGVLPQSAAYYGTGPGEREAAEAIARELGIQAQPRPDGFDMNTPGVIVIVTQDLQR